MPFTLAHPAAVLPLRGVRYLRTAPLIVGALVPDTYDYVPANLRHLLHHAHSFAGSYTSCIVLGYAADSTMGNAIETAKWMDAEHYRSLRIVTAAYHMPRSMLEFRRAMPQIRLIPNPVFPERVKSDWWLWPGSAYLVLGEYHKYLAALARESVPEIALPGSQQTDS